jgi:hypothetical protein
MPCPRTEADWVKLPVTTVRIAELSYGVGGTDFHPAKVQDLATWPNLQPIRVCQRDGVKRLHDGKHRTERARLDGREEIAGRICTCGAP